MSKLYKHIGHFLHRGRKKPIVNHFRHRKPIGDAFRGYLSMQFSRFTIPDVTFSLVPPLHLSSNAHSIPSSRNNWEFYEVSFWLFAPNIHPGNGHRLSMRSSIFLLDPPNISETFILDYRSFPMNWKFIEYWMAHYITENLTPSWPSFSKKDMLKSGLTVKLGA